MSQVSPVDLISLSMMTEALQSLRSPESARHLSLCFSLQEAAHSQLKSSCCPSDSDSDVYVYMYMNVYVNVFFPWPRPVTPVTVTGGRWVGGPRGGYQSNGLTNKKRSPLRLGQSQSTRGNPKPQSW